MMDIGRYSVSMDGVIKNTESGRTLLQKTTKSGYKTVCLYLSGGKKYRYVHRLVAETYIENKDGLPVINHKNGRKDDNRADNLEWCTQSHNIKHSFATGLQSPTVLIGDKHGMYKGPIIATSLDGEIKIEIRALTECHKHGFNNGHVSSCIIGNLKQHKGFTFKRIEK